MLAPYVELVKSMLGYFHPSRTPVEKARIEELALTKVLSETEQFVCLELGASGAATFNSYIENAYKNGNYNQMFGFLTLYLTRIPHVNYKLHNYMKAMLADSSNHLLKVKKELIKS